MTAARGLSAFLDAVDARVDLAISEAPFCQEQRARLHAAVSWPRAALRSHATASPFALLYLLARAAGAEIGPKEIHAGAFSVLHVLSLDLFDDVQDDDLAGKPYSTVGAPLAINGALALTFLALDELRRASELAPPAQALRMLRLYNRVSLAAVSGQERDLMGARGAESPDEVLAMQEAKTSSVTLMVELGGLLAGYDAHTQSQLRSFGERLAQFVQVRDDLCDIYGKAESPDLLTSKVTYPIALLRQVGSAAELAELDAITADLPSSMPSARDLFYRSGVVLRCAEKLEQLREEMHRTLAGVDAGSPQLRMLLSLVDELASSVYRPAPVRASRALFRPNTPYHREVRRQGALFERRLRALGYEGAPPFVPWHHPHWMYSGDDRQVYYPDIEGLADETLGFQSFLLGEPDLGKVASIMRAQLPAVVAHELFHALRDRAGRLTRDHWHEEWAANRLAVSYLAEHEPTALASALALAERVLARFPLSAQGEAVLARCAQQRAESEGYGLPMTEIAAVTLAMVRDLARAPSPLPQAVAELLGPPLKTAEAGNAAAPRGRSASRTPRPRAARQTPPSPSCPS